MRLITKNYFKPQTPTFSSFLDAFLHEDLFQSIGAFNHRNNFPAVNIEDNKDSFIFEINAAGYEKEDFKIEFKDDKLTVGAKLNNEPKKKETEQYLKQEFNSKSFERSFIVKESIVELTKITATYKNGVLKVILPKKIVEEKKLTINVE